MLLNVGSGGGAAAAPAAGGAAAASGGAAADEPAKEEEKEEGTIFLLSPSRDMTDKFQTEKEESDEDMGFGLFD
jgi:large subunit ribosomal protein LP1